MTTRSEAIEAAGRVLATAVATRDALTPHQAAQAAADATSTDVAALEETIRARRGLPRVLRDTG